MRERPEKDHSLVLVGHQVFDVTTGTWRGGLSALAPSFVHAELEEGSEGTTWLIGRDETLRAIDLWSGEVLWEQPLTSPAQLVAVGHDDILIASDEEVWCHRKSDGVGREVAWFEDLEVEHLAHLGQYAVVGLSDSTFRIWNLVSGEEVGRVEAWPTQDPLAVPPGRRPIVEGVAAPSETRVFPTRRMTFCVLTELERHFDLRCFDAFGELVWQQAVEHTRVSWLDGQARVLDKRIDLAALGPRYVLFSPCGPGAESALVRLAAGEVTLVAHDVSAVVEDSEGWVRGFLVVDLAAEVLRFIEPDGRGVRWELEFEFAPANSATIALGVHGAIVALYHPFQNELTVFAVDLSTGRTFWRSRLAIPRTSFRLRHQFNQVELLHTKEALVVRIQQNPRSFIFVLDPRSGRCVFPDVDMLSER